MKKIMAGVIFGFILGLTTVIHAQEYLDIVTSQTKLYLNGKYKDIPSEYTTLSYNGHYYIPLRYLTEELKGKVFYDDSDDSVNVTFNSFESVPLKGYSLQEAKKNGDVIVTNTGILNNNHLEAFVENVTARKSDWIRITEFTTEGDPIIYELTNDGNHLLLVKDTTRDTYGEKGKQISVCSEVKKDKDGTSWLTGCSNIPDTSLPEFKQRH